jgi:hypothetical protein
MALSPREETLVERGRDNYNNIKKKLCIFFFHLMIYFLYT